MAARRTSNCPVAVEPWALQDRQWSDMLSVHRHRESVCGRFVCGWSRRACHFGQYRAGATERLLTYHTVATPYLRDVSTTIVSEIVPSCDLNLELAFVTVEHAVGT